jgi:hypothetical protein
MKSRHTTYWCRIWGFHGGDSLMAPHPRRRRRHSSLLHALTVSIQTLIVSRYSLKHSFTAVFLSKGREVLQKCFLQRRVTKFDPSIFPSTNFQQWRHFHRRARSFVSLYVSLDQHSVLFGHLVAPIRLLLSPLNTNLQWISLWLNPSASKTSDHRADHKLAIIFSHSGQFVRL